MDPRIKSAGDTKKWSGRGDSPRPQQPTRLPAMVARARKTPDFDALKQRLAAALGDKGVGSAPDEVAPYLEEQRRRYRGATPFVVRPASTDEVATTVKHCRPAGVASKHDRRRVGQEVGH